MRRPSVLEISLEVNIHIWRAVFIIPLFSASSRPWKFTSGDGLCVDLAFCRGYGIDCWWLATVIKVRKQSGVCWEGMPGPDVGTPLIGETVCLSTNRDSQAGCRRAPASQTGRQSDSCRIDKAKRRRSGSRRKDRWGRKGWHLFGHGMIWWYHYWHQSFTWCTILLRILQSARWGEATIQLLVTFSGIMTRRSLYAIDSSIPRQFQWLMKWIFKDFVLRFFLIWKIPYATMWLCLLQKNLFHFTVSYLYSVFSFPKYIIHHMQIIH